VGAGREDGRWKRAGTVGVAHVAGLVAFSSTAARKKGQHTSRTVNVAVIIVKVVVSVSKLAAHDN
jgi:hypothetical protein